MISGVCGDCYFTKSIIFVKFRALGFDLIWYHKIQVVFGASDEKNIDKDGVNAL